MVMEMKAKTNELDLLLVTFLKDNIEKFIGLLVNIVNISLQLGVFARDWKMALLHPLIKKAGLEVIKIQFLTSFKFVIHFTVGGKSCHWSTGSTCRLL